tara:strand:- start:94 stop:438 length:345 start_codon:yes stop_codon:yes gene_type:complete
MRVGKGNIKQQSQKGTTKMKKSIETLDDFLNSDYYDSKRFGSSNDDWIYNPERMQRIVDNAPGDGSTHSEHIEDWREALHWLEIDDEVKESILSEIDSVEKYHKDNGSLFEVIG